MPQSLCVFSEWNEIDGTYCTIDIILEPELSYVCFETNLSQTSYDDKYNGK